MICACGDDVTGVPETASGGGSRSLAGVRVKIIMNLTFFPLPCAPEQKWCGIRFALPRHACDNGGDCSSSQGGRHLEESVNPKLKDEGADRLFEAILQLQTIEECYAFFEDVGTISELKAFVQRFDVARMLAERKTYREIHEKTGASEATISRVSRALHYGADGYQIVLRRLGFVIEDGAGADTDTKAIFAPDGAQRE